MRHARLMVGVFALTLVCTPAAASEEVTVQELTEMSAELAGTEVVVEGELVGDYGFRGDGWMWTQLNGDVYSRDPLHEGGEPAGGNIGVGVRIPSQLANDLDAPGGYRNRGPLVRVNGIWRYHDPVRQGESFLDVTVIEVVEPARRFVHGSNWWGVAGGLVLLAAAGVVWVTRPTE